MLIAVSEIVINMRVDEDKSGFTGIWNMYSNYV